MTNCVSLNGANYLYSTYDQHSCIDRFLLELHLKLQTYQIQKDIGISYFYWKNLLPKVRQIKNVNDNMEVLPTTDLNEFLALLARKNLTRPYLFATEKMVFRDIINRFISIVSQILDFNLGHSLEVTCFDSYKLLARTHICAKDIKNLLSNSHCDSKNTVIMAFNKIFIDDDINNEGGSLAILSPEVEIIGKNRKINVNGKDAKNYLANSGNGRPGLPGEPAGTFYGEFESFKAFSKNYLIISVVGGAGGAGEDGKNVTRVADVDSEPRVPQGLECRPGLCEKNKKIDNFPCKLLECKKSTVPVYSYDSYFFFHTECTYEISRSVEPKITEAGNGGRGGYGGSTGVLGFHSKRCFPGPECAWKYIFETGAEGKNGTGGTVLHQFENKENNKVVNSIQVGCTNLNNKWKLVDKKETDADFYNKNGTEGGNLEGIKNATPAMVNVLPIKVILQEYKHYLLKRIFFDELFHWNTDILNYYFRIIRDTEESQSKRPDYELIDIINDLKIAEEQFYEPATRTYDKELKKKVIRLLYDMLDQRLLSYSKQHEDDKKASKYKKVQRYLIHNVLNKINSFNEPHYFEPELVTNLNEYLSYVKEDVTAFKKLEKVKSKTEIAMDMKKKMEDEVNEKIKEARDIIEKHITLDIDKINERMNKNIEKYIKEVIDFKDNILKDREQLLKKREDLENAAKMKVVFGSLKVMSTLVNFLGPVGSSISMVVNTANSAVESAVDADNNVKQLLTLPNSVVKNLQVVKDQVNAMKTNKVKEFNNLLNDLSDKIKDHPKELGDLSDRVESIKSRMSADKDSNNLEQYKTLKKELQETLKQKKDKLEAINNLSKAESTSKNDAFEVIKKFEQTSRLSSDILSLYDKFKKDKEQLNALNLMIEKNNENFEQLETYQDNIYKKIIPLIEKITKDLRSREFAKKSQVALDVTKWDVQDILKDLQSYLEDFMKGFKAQKAISDSIDKLNRAMNLLIKVYEDIQDYQKEKNTNNYIADIIATTPGKIYIDDPVVLKALNHLELTIYSNRLVRQYQIALNAFKQYVFPFSHVYLEESLLPTHLVYEEGQGNLAEMCVTYIDELIQKTREHKVFMGRNETFGISEFNHEEFTSEPLYSFTQRDFSNNPNFLENLFTGLPVSAMSNITQSSPDKDAFKIKNFFLNFKSKNETRQPELNDILKSFKLHFEHAGFSFYRYKGQIYYVQTKKSHYWYSFDKKKNGDPVHASASYYQLKNGDFVLSPFGVWVFDLETLNGGQDAHLKNFNKLNNFYTTVGIDLELHGTAQYVISNRIDNMDLHLKDYYDAVPNFDLSLMNSSSFIALRNSVHEYRVINKSSTNGQIRSKRKISRETGKIIELTGNNGSSDDKVNKQQESQSWFSWFDFNILPGADGAIIGEEVFNPFKTKCHNFIPGSCAQNSNADKSLGETSSWKSIASDFLKPITTSMSNFFQSKKETVSQMNNSNYIQERTFIQDSCSKIKLLDSDKYMCQISDIFKVDSGNLFLIQLLLAHKSKNNKFSLQKKYLSPDEEQQLKRHELFEEISPLLDDQFNSYENNDYFINEYNCSLQWYRDLLNPEM